MRRPFRRYCFHLAEKLGKTLKEILALDSSEITEWMAFDMTLDDEWQKKYKDDLEFERTANISAQEKAELFKKLFGGK